MKARTPALVAALAALLSLLLPLPACGSTPHEMPPVPLPLYITEGVDQDHADAYRDAAVLWNAATAAQRRGALIVREARAGEGDAGLDGGCGVYVVRPEGLVPADKGAWNQWVAPCRIHTAISGDVASWGVKSMAEARALMPLLAAHELGHVLMHFDDELDHSEDTGSVMFPNQRMGQTIGAADLAKLRAP